MHRGAASLIDPIIIDARYETCSVEIYELLASRKESRTQCADRLAQDINEGDSAVSVVCECESDCGGSRRSTLTKRAWIVLLDLDSRRCYRRLGAHRFLLALQVDQHRIFRQKAHPREARIVE